MGLPRSTYYDAPPVKTDDAEIVANITAICDEFEAYGYRRVGAELRHRGMVVNSKKIRRLMREHDLQPKRRRRFVATTDSDHDNPIFPDLARDRIVDGPNQLWVADITYIAIATGFVYLAAILDAWSRRVVGYAISRSIDARVAVGRSGAMSVEQRGPAVCRFSGNQEGKDEMTKASVNLQDLRRRIYVKAKADTTWRFWGMYVHVCKMETLREAYALAQNNDGAPGSDGVTFAAIEAQGVEGFLERIRDELVQHTYMPLPAAGDTKGRGQGPRPFDSCGPRSSGARCAQAHHTTGH